MKILVLIFFFYPMLAFSQSKCIQLFSEIAPIFSKGKQETALSQIETYFKAHLNEGEILLFRGQRRMTKTLPSIAARTSGIDESKKFLEESLLVKTEELEKSRAWLTKMISENGDKPFYKEIYATRQKELDALTPMDLVLIEHSGFLGAKSSFVSTSSSIEIASGNYQGGYANRFIYILKVPKEIPLKTFEARLKKRANDSITNEMEYSIPHDATEFIIGVVDTQTGVFYSHDQYVNFAE